MKKLERRIKELIKSRPGITSSEMIEYFSLDPKKVRNTLQDMKEKGAIVGKPVKGEYIGVADKMEVYE